MNLIGIIDLSIIPSSNKTNRGDLMEEKITKKQEQEDWLELANYVFKEILQYETGVKFPRYLALRLKGLHKGTFMANKKQKPQANYDYKIILLTCKFCKYSILQYLGPSRDKIKDERHLINTIMSFVENEINNVVLRLKNSKKAEEKTIHIELENQIHEGAEYTAKSKDKNIDKELEELW